MKEHHDPKAELLEAVPKLRAFAVSLCGGTQRADDLAACRTRDFRSNLATPVAVIELSVAP